MFQNNGRLIAVHPKKIAVNALKDEGEADKILNWITGEINDIWENRDEIKPCESVPEKPKIIEVLKLLPQTVESAVSLHVWFFQLLLLRE